MFRVSNLQHRNAFTEGKRPNNIALVSGKTNARHHQQLAKMHLSSIYLLDAVLPKYE